MAMCACQSYNQPQEGQTDPEVILNVPSWAPQDRPTVCVDRCIVPAVQALWSTNIWTLGSCCGHNDPDERWIIVDRFNRSAAEAVLQRIGDDAHVYAWELIGPNGRQFPRRTGEG